MRETYRIRVKRGSWFWRRFDVTGHKLDVAGGVPVLTLQLPDGRRRVMTSQGAFDLEVIPTYRAAARAVEPAEPGHVVHYTGLTPPAPALRPMVQQKVAPRRAAPAAELPEEGTELPEDVLDRIAAEEGVAAGLEDAQDAPEPRPSPAPPPEGRLEQRARGAAETRLMDMVAGRVRA